MMIIGEISGAKCWKVHEIIIIPVIIPTVLTEQTLNFCKLHLEFLVQKSHQGITRTDPS